MSDATWNNIRFKDWHDRELSLTTNEYGDDEDGPIVLEIRNGWDRISHWMSPAKARDLAAQLLQAAKACDKAGVRVSSENADAPPKAD